MEFHGTVPLNAAIANAWMVINDVNQFAACMPGVEEVRQIDDQSFVGSISANVGPITGKFAFTARIVESTGPDEPAAKCTHPHPSPLPQGRGECSMTAVVEGTDSVTKSAMTSEVRLTLEQTGPHETALAYQATVDIKGRLAILGDMVLRVTAAVMLEEFTKRLKKAVEWPSTGSGND